MTNIPKRFFLYATILLVVAIALSQLIFSTIFETKDFPLRIPSIVFVWLVTCASHYWVIKTVTDKPKAFGRVFMLQTTIRLMMYMACIIVYLVLYKQHGVPFTIHFFVIYLIFAIFEVASILKFVKQ
jgi:L-asparagine transporter-like permease